MVEGALCDWWPSHGPMASLMGCGGEKGSIEPKQNDADFWVGIWELLTDRTEKNWDLDVKQKMLKRIPKNGRGASRRRTEWEN